MAPLHNSKRPAQLLPLCQPSRYLTSPTRPRSAQPPLISLPRRFRFCVSYFFFLLISIPIWGGIRRSDPSSGGGRRGPAYPSPSSLWCGSGGGGGLRRGGRLQEQRLRRPAGAAGPTRAAHWFLLPIPDAPQNRILPPATASSCSPLA